MDWIQNDNEKGRLLSTPQSLTIIITSSLVTCYSITLHSFDAVLYLMIVLDYTWKHMLFRFLLHLCFLEILYRRCVLAPPNQITMKTLSLEAQAQIYLDFFKV